MDKKRVVLVDFDLISSAGLDKNIFAENILKKNNYSSEIDFEKRDFIEDSNDRGFILKDFDFSDILGKTGLKHINRNAKLSFVSIEKMLLKYFENLDIENSPSMILGSSFGTLDSIASFWETYLVEGFGGIRPLDFPNTTINSSGSFINIRYQLMNSSVTINNGFNSSNDAFIYSYDFIQNGYGDFVLVGGSEEFDKYLYLGLKKSLYLSKNSDYNIFSKNSDGIFPGEGSAFFILKELDRAIRDNDKIICELVGFSKSFSKDVKDVHSKLKCYEEAVNMAKINYKDIKFVSSGANGFSFLDRIYIDIYKKLFDDDTLVAFHKQFFGEMYGASGAMQLAATLSNIHFKRKSPILNSELLLENLPFFSNEKIDNVNYFVIDNFSIDGNNNVLIFKMWN